VKVKYNVKDKLLLFYPSVKVKYKVEDKLILFYVNCIIPINEGQKLYVKGVLFIYSYHNKGTKVIASLFLITKIFTDE
jgi:hypothetical protein